MEASSGRASEKLSLDCSIRLAHEVCRRLPLYLYMRHHFPQAVSSEWSLATHSDSVYTADFNAYARLTIVNTNRLSPLFLRRAVVRCLEMFVAKAFLQESRPKIMSKIIAESRPPDLSTRIAPILPSHSRRDTRMLGTSTNKLL
jgi:hypothetical protein